MGATPKLLFTEKAIPLILEAYGKSINDDGIIIDTKTGEPVYTKTGELIPISNFGGIKKGSEIFLKDDLGTIINLVEEKY